MARPLVYQYRETQRDLDRAMQHVREAEQLRRKYGEVFEDVKRTFLALPPEVLSKLLKDYGERYGDAAKQYAHQTMGRWKSGGVIMSGQTMTRLLDLVPRHLTSDEKFALVEKIRLETLRKLRQSEIKLRVKPTDSTCASLACIAQLIQKQTAVELPRSFYELRGWINADDAVLMQDLVLALEKEALYIRTADLFYQVALLQRLRKTLPRAKLVRITFDLPTARVVIAIDRPNRRELRKMMNSPDSDDDLLLQLQRIENEQRYQKGDIGFHEYLLKNMDSLSTPEQLNELKMLAVKQGLELDRLKSEIVMKGQTSGHDIKAFVDLVEDLKQRGTKADLTGKYTTPSGEIEIKAKTSRFGCSILPFGVLAAGIACSLVR